MMKRYLLDLGFQHKKDTDYIHDGLHWLEF